MISLIEGDETVTLDFGSRATSQATRPNAPTSEVMIVAGDCDEATVTIEDNDGVVPTVAGVYANSTDWTELFRDRVAGTELGGSEDGSTFGYELTGRADQNETLPWINVNQFIVEFDQPITGMLDAADFDLSIVPDTGFVPVNGTLTAVASAPMINSVVAGPGNTAIVTLDAPIEASRYVLDINASGIEFAGSSVGTDTDYQFLSLPGDADDSTNSLFSVNGDDVQDIIGRQGSLIFPGSSFGPYSFRADLDGNSIINGDDSIAAVELTSSIVIPPPAPLTVLVPLSSFAISPVDSPFDDESSLAVGQDSENLLAGDGIEELAGASDSAENTSFLDQDEVFSGLFEGDSIEDELIAADAEVFANLIGNNE